MKLIILLLKHKINIQSRNNFSNNRLNNLRVVGVIVLPCGRWRCAPLTLTTFFLTRNSCVYFKRPRVETCDRKACTEKCILFKQSSLYSQEESKWAMDDIEAELNIAHDAPEDDQERLQMPVYIHYHTNEKGDVLVLSHHIFLVFMWSRQLNPTDVLMFRCTLSDELSQDEQKVSTADQRGDAAS